MPKKKKIDKKKELLILCSLILIVIIVSLLSLFLVSKDEKWIQTGNTITKGGITYKIGDYYAYDETNEDKIKDLTDVKWKVMGIDEEGNLLILSASSVEQITLGKKDDIETTKKDYIEGISRLNSIAKKYGNGENALDARSITLTDINKITRYENTNMETFGKETTYYWGTSENPLAQTEDSDMVDIKIQHNNQFIWYDKNTNEWAISKKDDTLNYDTPIKITTLKNELIAYSNRIYDGTSENKQPLLDENSSEFKMIFSEENGGIVQYWTATSYINAVNRYVGHGYNVVRGDSINYSNLLYSSGDINEITAGVRVVVTID